MAQSKTELVDQLREIGIKLASPPADPQHLFSLLDQTEKLLSRVEQSPDEPVVSALSPAMKALVNEKLLNQSQDDLKVAIASCMTEVTRITAPFAPYDDDLMKEIFRMIVNAFEKLDDLSSPLYQKRVSILEIVANIRSCVVMLDLECDALVLEMFQYFVKAIRPSHTNRVFSLMENIMTLVLVESEAISPDLPSCLLLSVKEDNKDVSPIARKLVEKVIKNCAVKLKPYLMEVVKSTGTSLSDYSSIVAAICQGDSNALEPEKLEREVSSPEEFGTAENKPPPTVNGNSVVEPASPEQKSEQSPHIVQSQTAAIACRDELDSLSFSMAVSLESLPDNTTKKKRGRKSNSSIHADTHNYSRLDNDTEAPAVKRRRASGSNKAFDCVNVFVSSTHPIEDLPDTSQPKGAPPSVHKETSGSSQTGEEPLASNSMDTKKENEGICDSKGKPRRRSGRKELKENTSNCETPYKEISSTKEIDGSSDLVTKPLELTSKRGSTVSITKTESSGKQRRAKLKQQKGPTIVGKALEEPSSKNYKAELHKKDAGKKLVGSRIEVWWPDDERFYPGVIVHYFPDTMLHKISYNDGDVEELMLNNEVWKLADATEANVQGPAKNFENPNASSKKRVKVEDPAPNSASVSKLTKEATLTTVETAETREGSIATILPHKRPLAETETITKWNDPQSAEGAVEISKKGKSLENVLRFSNEKESHVKGKDTRRKMSTSNSPAILHDPSPAPAPTVPEEKHSMTIALVKKAPVSDEEIEDLIAIEAKKRLQREKRRSTVTDVVHSPMTPKASSCDDSVDIKLNRHIFDTAFMEKIRVFSQIIQNKWYQTNLDPLPDYAELVDEFGRNAAFDHGDLFKTIRQSPHYQGVDTAELEDLWYKLPLVFEGLHKSFESQKYLERNIETLRGWLTKLTLAGFDISVPSAALYLLTVSPTDFKNFRESLESLSIEIDEEKQNVEVLRSKLPVSERVAGLESKIEDLRQQLRDLESERMALEGLRDVELEIEKYGMTLKAFRLERLRELFEKEITEAEQFLRDVSLDSWFERTSLAALTQ